MSDSKPRVVVVLDADGIVDPSTIRSLIRDADQTKVLVIDLPDVPGVEALKGLLLRRQRHELALAADRPKLPAVDVGKLISYIQPVKPLHRKGPRWVAPAKRKGR